MNEQYEQEYDDSLIELLELVWGEGYLSPGGSEEIDRLLDGFELTGKRVLDIGCGCGGIDQLLVEQYGANHVTGIDVESRVIEKSKARAKDKNLDHRLSFQQVEPGPLPFAENSFEVVFSKDAIIHIADKRTLCRDTFRVLEPGGLFVAGDWMRGDGPVSEDMQRYLELEGLDFGMANPEEYEQALKQAGFESIRLIDRNEWYREIAKQEHARMSGPLYDQLVAIQGKEFADREIGVWEAMIVVLDKGELRPTHMSASKPRG